MWLDGSHADLHNGAILIFTYVVNLIKAFGGFSGFFVRSIWIKEGRIFKGEIDRSPTFGSNSTLLLKEAKVTSWAITEPLHNT